MIHVWNSHLHLLVQGLYKCRVDFATAPTRISNIVLDVIVPPEKPRIHDENNQEVRLKLGPYKLGDTVTVTCEVSDLERWRFLQIAPKNTHVRFLLFFSFLNLTEQYILCQSINLWQFAIRGTWGQFETNFLPQNVLSRSLPLTNNLVCVEAFFYWFYQTK